MASLSHRLKIALLGLALAGTAASASAEPMKSIEVGTRPESVTRGFDGHLYVTVMNGQEPGDGVIKVIKGDSVEIFATGFDEPKGIAFAGDHLVTTDLQRVWKIDAQGKATVLAQGDAFPIPAIYLNDASAAPDGKSVYVTDMGARDKMNGPDGLWPLDSPEAKAIPAVGRVYQIALDGTVTLAVDASPKMLNPNGVCAEADGNLLVTGFFLGNVLRAEGGTLNLLASGFRGGDGIERGKDGSIYLSSWTQGKVWRLDADGKNPRLMIEGLKAAADFHLDEQNGALIVPDMLSGTLIWVPLDAKAVQGTM
jgi:sugar lactone lactonase YvrE